MNQLVNVAFDTVGWLSSFLTQILEVIARGDSDARAAIILGCCLLIVTACFSIAVKGAPVVTRMKRVLVPLGVLLALGLLMCRAGTDVTTLHGSKLRHSEGLGWKVKLPESLSEELKSRRWWLVSSEAGMSAGRWLLQDGGLRPTSSVMWIKSRGGGLYREKDGVLWLSPRSGADVPAKDATFKIVREKKWSLAVRKVLAWGFLFFSFAVLLKRLLPVVKTALVLRLRDPLFVVPLLLFLAAYGWHQTRFIEQDGRMQLVTSRDDDGYMLDRLVVAAETKTMDPWKLNNTAYGAIGFFPFAFPAFIAGHLGIDPTVSALNISTRGQKVLISALMLAAVWFLAARHFGRLPAFGAVLLTATHEGFLFYSSYPFYPDVLMALFAVLSLAFLLDLTARWDSRSFLLAVTFAAMSVSVKFLTFLLFPLIALVAGISLWRHASTLPSPARRSVLARTVGTAAVVCVAVFFLCNPYLEYNIGWLVPNYKLCGSYYSAESPNVVGGGAASWADWVETCYRLHGTETDLVLGALSLFMVAFCPAGARLKAALLVGFAFLLQAYLLRSITLRSAIDTRLLLPGLPPLYVAVTAGLVALAASARNRLLPGQGKGTSLPPAATARYLAAGILSCAVLGLMMPRFGFGMAFLRDFGRFPRQSAVAEWLNEIALQDDDAIVTSLQSYFPSRYLRVSDGIWRPEMVSSLLYSQNEVASVFIEDPSYYREFFFHASSQRPSMTGPQQQLFEAGGTFYRDLRFGRMLPFRPIFQDMETMATNCVPGPGLIAPFLSYVNPHHGAPDLAKAHDASSASDGTGAIIWSAPQLAGLIHVIAKEPQTTGLKLMLEEAGGGWSVVDLRSPSQRWAPSTHWFATLSPPRTIKAARVVMEDGKGAAHGTVKELRAFAPAPVTINPTSYHFDLVQNENEPRDLSSLISQRAGAKGAVEVPPGRSCTVHLKARRPTMVEAIWLTLADDASAEVAGRCSLVLADGRRTELAASKHALPASQSAGLQFCLTEPSPVRQVQIEISNPASSASGGRPLILRQLSATARDVESGREGDL